MANLNGTMVEDDIDAEARANAARDAAMLIEVHYRGGNEELERLAAKAYIALNELVKAQRKARAAA